jgi:hypothetical protein
MSPNVRNNARRHSLHIRTVFPRDSSVLHDKILLKTRTVNSYSHQHKDSDEIPTSIGILTANAPAVIPNPTSGA